MEWQAQGYLKPLVEILVIRNLSYPAVFAALATLIVFLIVATLRNGTFEYPLDDVYIHLAMAEQMAAGGYGVNAGEVASAASSPIYPLFLMPFAGSEVQRWMPLFWNVVALIVAAVLFARILAEARLGRTAMVFAIVAPFALSMYVTAYAGMENMAHGAASLGIVLGLWRYVETGRIGWLLILSILLAPAFRLEGLALVLLAGAVVMRLGRVPAGLGLILIGIAPVVGFAAYLMSLGLDPLPNSIMAKLGDQPGGFGSTLRNNAASYGGRYLLGLSVALAIVSFSFWNRDRRRAFFGLGMAAAGFAHLAFGSTGWLDRYENYAVLTVVASLALMVSDLGRVVKIGVTALALLGGVLTYAPYIPNNLANMRAIHLQQAQMARFAKDHVKAPVAVNDLGYVAWRNPNYVLDLWGLAYSPALQLRRSGDCKSWVDMLADERGVRVAMIYDDWLGCNLGPDWVRLGGLWTDDAAGAFLGGPEVAFYARNAAEAAGLQADLSDWAEGLPEGARWEGGS